MCGICGFVGGDSAETLDGMTSLLAHRGPDDSGTYLSAPLRNGARAGLGSRRLSILDLSPAGHMPMQNDDGTVRVVFNGEIYNYPELRNELEAKGRRFRSHSDTEVLVYLYEDEGPEFVRHLNGMFAIAIWDARHNRLFLARDHFGIKPLYYVQDARRFAFASEVKSFLQLPGFSSELDPEALHRYLTFLWVPDPQTMFRRVLKLPAGHYAVLQDGTLTVVEYWDLTFPDAGHVFEQDEESLALELRERFTRAVRSQLLSDVPVGAFLSAGLDSSSIVAAVGHPLRTYTVAFPDRYKIGETASDDTNVAARTARHFGCDHTELLVEPDVVDLLPRLIWHMDEPVADPAIITAFLVNREASRHVKVLLSGVGGDELFAGYRKHSAHYLSKRYQQIPSFLRRELIEPAVSALPSMRGTRVKGLVRLAKKMARSGSLPPESRFLTDSTYLSEEQKDRLYTPSLRARTKSVDPWRWHRAHFARVATADFLNQMLYLDTKAFMVSLNLTYNDKMSMASSVEVRVPFLDWQLAEWVAHHVPPSAKLRGRTTKYLLRKAMAPVLPPEVLTQKKAGFGAPVDYWLAYDLREMVDDLLSEDRVRRRGLFEPAAVRKLVEEQRSGRQDWSMQIWQLLTLELWSQGFTDRSAARSDAQMTYS
jgi:asparagine synthase (glutamine-hydrolysing)